ncbi:hypothetical protein AVEN_126235-1, partial [Araneus ventricosus]
AAGLQQHFQAGRCRDWGQVRMTLRSRRRPGVVMTGDKSE